MRLLTLDELPWDLMPELERRAFVRVDFNVPMRDGVVVDDFRIRQAVPTIEYLLEQKCIVVLAAHFGRPLKDKEAKKEKYSLLPIAEKLAEIMDHEVVFSEDTTGSAVEKLIYDARPGKSIILLENVRFFEGEEKNDSDFAEKLFGVCDFYVNDAFGGCHRSHASIDAVARLTQKRAMGRLLQKEWESLNQALHHPLKPQVAVLGGAKIADKIQVIKNLMDKCSAICVGGRMGQTFLAAKGAELGLSSVETDAFPLARRLIAEAKNRGIKMYFPVDGRAAEKIDATEAQVVEIDAVPPDLGLFDIGPKTLESWKEVLETAQSVIWNGPLGVFENPAFAEGTLSLVDYLVANKDRIQTVAGGGETVAAITQRGALKTLHHVSTGGGAMLEFLEGKKLPGFEALELRDREIEALSVRQGEPLEEISNGG